MNKKQKSKLHEIFVDPFVVFYEDVSKKKLKPFKKQFDAHNFANENLNKGIHSILISIMNRNIECKIYKVIY